MDHLKTVGARLRLALSGVIIVFGIALSMSIVRLAAFNSTESAYDLVVAGKAADPPTRRGLSTAAIEMLLVKEGAALFRGERPCR